MWTAHPKPYKEKLLYKRGNSRGLYGVEGTRRGTQRPARARETLAVWASTQEPIRSGMDFTGGKNKRKYESLQTLIQACNLEGQERGG